MKANSIKEFKNDIVNSLNPLNIDYVNNLKMNQL
jgi:hypothetical protein